MSYSNMPNCLVLLRSRRKQGVWRRSFLREEAPSLQVPQLHQGLGEIAHAMPCHHGGSRVAFSNTLGTIPCNWASKISLLSENYKVFCYYCYTKWIYKVFLQERLVAAVHQRQLIHIKCCLSSFKICRFATGPPPALVLPLEAFFLCCMPSVCKFFCTCGFNISDIQSTVLDVLTPEVAQEVVTWF